MPKLLMVFLLRNKMTLKDYLESEGINITNDQRMKLGQRVSSIFDSLRKGKKIYKQEGEFMVRDYCYYFLSSKTVSKSIIKFLTKEVDNG